LVWPNKAGIGLAQSTMNRVGSSPHSHEYQQLALPRSGVVLSDNVGDILVSTHNSHKGRWGWDYPSTSSYWLSWNKKSVLTSHPNNM